MTNKDPDTMTPEELSCEIAKAMGWRRERYTPPYTGPINVWVDKKGIRHLSFHLLTNWYDWGIVYEWMVGEGWKSEHGEYLHAPEEHRYWKKWDGRHKSDIGRIFVADGPDLRVASVKAALKALKAEGGLKEKGD